ncbi:MAG: hypothetical protein ABIC04_01360 [Nanoarchaeota archaeon]
MKLLRYLIGIILITLFLPIATAVIQVNIDIKDKFIEGQQVTFKYTIISSDDGQFQLYEYISCDGNIWKSTMQVSAVELIKDTPLTLMFEGPLIDNSVGSQSCISTVEIIEPQPAKFSENFKIVSKPSFSFRTNYCMDLQCIEKSTIFIKNNEIYLNYESEVENPDIRATLTNPDGSKEQITLPHSVRADQIGTYTLDATASKDGYKTMSHHGQFTVLEKEVEIKSASRCNANSICEQNENHQNCSQDCLSGEADNYCDKLSDGKCDPDCETGDFDCEAKKTAKLVKDMNKKDNLSLIVIFTVAALILIFSLLELHRYRYHQELRKERVMQELLELKTYIRVNFGKGFGKKQIRDELLKDGWKEELVDKAFLK